MQRLFWIVVHKANGDAYACFGIISQDNIVIDAAPIAGWMTGKTLHEIKPWLLMRKAIVKEV